MRDDTKCIGLFGGTFDPVHNGHLSIAKSFLNSGIIDELWILLNPSPPHKPDETFAPFEIRLQMLRTAFQPIEKTKISDLEAKLPKPTYTLQTVAHLTKNYPNHTFYLCMGKDSYLHFNTWHKWRSILEYCNLLVAERPTNKDQDKTITPVIKKKTTFVEHTKVDISSTHIRKALANGESIDHLVPENVADIIRDNQLYR